MRLSGGALNRCLYDGDVLSLGTGLRPGECCVPVLPSTSQLLLLLVALCPAHTPCRGEGHGSPVLVS